MVRGHTPERAGRSASVQEQETRSHGVGRRPIPHSGIESVAESDCLTVGSGIESVTESDGFTVGKQVREVELASDGRIIDYLDRGRRLPNKPEERVRQRMTRSMHRELGYPAEHIEIECPVKMGGETKRADIVVYNSAAGRAAKDQGDIFLIAEVKNPGITEPDGQLLSYISATSAQGGLWTNGERTEYYRKDAATGRIVSWLGVPKYGEAWDSIGKYRKRDLVVPVDLKLTFVQCHNILYRTGIDSEDIAMDMVRVILSKLEDESGADDECAFHITPEEFARGSGRTAACARVRALFDAVRDRHKDVFSKHERITASDAQLAVVVAQLQGYNFLDSPHDVIGTAYEVYMSSHLKGERGQFFTSRPVVDMMVRMAAPTERDVVLDLACGSGGFLLSSMNHVFDRIRSSSRSEESKEVIRRNAVHNLFGIDISPKLVKIAKANMLIAKDGHGGVERANSLGDENNLSERFRELCGPGKPDIILTNPPFGSGHELRIREPEILRRFEIGRQWTATDGEVSYGDALNTGQGVAPELLFLERCLTWIKEGGVVGIVMAKGQLDNREALAARKLLCSRARILAVVNLHEDIFQPFCGSRASVVLFRKERNVPKDYRIFMAISNKAGQTSRGEAVLKVDKEGKPVVENGRHIVEEDMTEIADMYAAFLAGELAESDCRFTTAFSGLDADMSLNPVRYLPRHNAAMNRILTLDENKFSIHRLGDLAKVYNGPRFKRPYAEPGHTDGPDIRRYYTGTALTQTHGENVKYLDVSRADAQARRHIESLVIREGYILVSDSGTLGRVTYALSRHDGATATNNLIRVVVEDRMLRGYIYQFLRSGVGQSLMLKNAYGTNQEHLEPDTIADILVPIPRDRAALEEIGAASLRAIEYFEASMNDDEKAGLLLENSLS